MNPMIPMLLPPAVPGQGVFTGEDRPHVGDEIAFEDLVPGETYFRRFVLGAYANVNDNYDEIILVDKLRDGSGQLTGQYSYRIPYPVRYEVNESGQPVNVLPVPLTPHIFNPYEVDHFNTYEPGVWRFYKVAPVRRGRHIMAPFIKQKLKKNIKRKHLNITLNQLGFSTNVGTGPADIIRKFVNLQPPKGAKGPAELRSRTVTNKRLVGGKKRKTRRNA
jgi:hypothetical protein